MNFFKEAREIIRHQPTSAKTAILRERVDELQEAYDLFVVERTTDSLARLTSRWTRAKIAIDAINGTEPLPPAGGKQEVPPLAA